MITQPLHIETPLFEDVALGQALGKSIWLKMECFQPCGSFKIRGIGLLCQEELAAGAEEFICSSGGNAGYATAYIGHRLGVPVTVFVPGTTPAETRARLRSLSAEVEVRGDVWDETDQYARARAASAKSAYISPSDHPLIWRGHATMVDEVAPLIDKPDTVVVSVGAGGFMCGVIEGMQRNGWEDVPVVAVETEGTHSFNAAVAAGKLVTLPEITSIANCLAAKQTIPKALEMVAAHPINSVLVPDRAAVRACLEFAHAHRMLVEPACGASLSMLYENHPAIADADSVLVIVCGGISVTIDQLEKWWRMLDGGPLPHAQ